VTVRWPRSRGCCRDKMQPARAVDRSAANVTISPNLLRGRLYKRPYIYIKNVIFRQKYYIGLNF